MDGWGIEVMPEISHKVSVAKEETVHISQACCSGKMVVDERVFLYVKNENYNEQVVIGILFPESDPQASFDLVFGTDFELSHSSRNETIHFTGYKYTLPEKVYTPSADDEEEDSDGVTDGDELLKQKLNEVPADNDSDGDFDFDGHDDYDDVASGGEEEFDGNDDAFGDPDDD